MTINSVRMTRALDRWMRDFSGWANPILLIGIALSAGFLYSNPFRPLILLGATEGLCTLIKLIYWKPRPTKKGYRNWKEKIENGAFPSIHSARAAFTSLVLFGALLQLGPLWPGILVGLAFYFPIAYSRIYLKKHDWIDILFGTLIGVGFGLILLEKAPLLQQLF